MSKLPFGLRMAKMAQEQSQYKIKVGAALVNGSKVIIAWNENKTSPAIVRLKYPWHSSLHAETNLFGHLAPPVKGYVYVYRAWQNGRLALARPCECCMVVLKLYGIKKCCYTIEDGWQWEKIV